MRITKAGKRYFMDESIQRQAEIAQAAGKPQPTVRDAWLSLTRQDLTDLDYFATRCNDEALPVVTARAAIRLLIEYLERNR
jgi:hypothetical protein